MDKLSQCKNIEEFNSFVEKLNMSSYKNGRHFCVSNSKDSRTYTMNQIVHQFKYCIEKSSCDATEVKSGILEIKRLNEKSAKVPITRMRQWRKITGNLLYSLTHFGFKKEAVLEKIEKKFSNVQATPTKNTAAVAVAPKVAPHVKCQFFGGDEWKEHLGYDVGKVPPLPPNIDDILESECPFYKGKKIGETHQLVLIVKTTDGKAFNLSLFGERVMKKCREKFPDLIEKPRAKNPLLMTVNFVDPAKKKKGSLYMVTQRCARLPSEF